VTNTLAYYAYYITAVKSFTTLGADRKNMFETELKRCQTNSLNKHSVEAIVNSSKKRKMSENLSENGVETCSKEKRSKTFEEEVQVVENTTTKR